jgi:hypothetical protein
MMCAGSSRAEDVSARSYPRRAVSYLALHVCMHACMYVCMSCLMEYAIEFF